MKKPPTQSFIKRNWKFLLTVLIVPITIALIQTLSSKEGGAESAKQQSLQAPKLDSGTQNTTANQIEQENKNTGDVITEIISGNKNVNHFTPPEIKKSEPKKEAQPTTKIDGQNVQVNYGDNNSQNIYEEKMRTLTDVEKAELLHSFPSKESRINLLACNDRECIKYAQQIINLLKAQGYTNVSDRIGQVAGMFSGPKRNFYIQEEQTMQNGEVVSYYLVCVVPDTSD